MYNRDNIQSGDLLVWTGDEIGGKDEFYLKLVRLMTMSDYGHVSIAWKVQDTLYHVEATQPEITFTKVSNKASFYRIPIGIPVSDQQMSSFFDSKLGLKYSFLDAFYAYIGKTLKDEDRWQCVELANYFYRSIGIDVGPVYVPNRFVRALMGKTGQPLVYYGPLALEGLA